MSQKVKYSGFCATNIEKFRTMRIPIKSANDSNFKTASGPDRPLCEVSFYA